MADIQEEKKRALQQAVTQIERQFGKGSIMKLGTDSLGESIPWTRSLRKNHLGFAHYGRGSEKKRRCRFHRCRACL